MAGWWAETVGAWRRVRRGRSYAPISATLVAPAIGLNAAIIGLVVSLMSATPPGLHQAQRIVDIGGFGTLAEFDRVQPLTRSMELAGYTSGTVHVEFSGRTYPVNVECVTPNYLAVLGARPQAGRAFSTDPANRAEDQIAIVSDSFWRRRMGQRQNVLGTVVVLRRAAYTVVGVAPPRFIGLGWRAVDLWIPLDGDRDVCSSIGGTATLSRDALVVDTFARLREGYRPSDARAELTALVPRPATGKPITLETLKDSHRRAMAGDRPIVGWLLGGGLVALLLACINAAAIAAASASSCFHEVAVKSTFGARTGTLAWALLAESLAASALSMIGGGVAYSAAGHVLYRFYPLQDPAEYGSHGVAWALIGLVTLLTCAGSAAVPTIRCLRSSPSAFLRRGTASSVPSGWSRKALIVGQFGIAFSSLLVAGLFWRSVSNLRDAVGVDIDRILSVAVDPLEAVIPDDESAQPGRTALYQRLLREPSLGDVALASYAPFDTSPHTRVFARLSPGSMPQSSMVNFVSPGYFRAMGTPALGGREFNDTDSTDSPPVVIVSQDVALGLWQTTDVVGRCLYLMGRTQCARVVGVVPANRARLITASIPEVYLPLAQRAVYGLPFIGRTIVVKTDSPSQAGVVIDTLARSAVPGIPVEVSMSSELAAPQTRSWRLGAAAFGLVGALTVILALTGVYYSVSTFVRSRSSETGVRLALGASRARVTLMFVKHGTSYLVIGWAVGVGLGLALSAVIRTLLFGVEGLDVGVFVGASCCVFIAGLLACVVPALRASAIDPLTVLRRE
jgi:predicted permease